MSSGDQGGAGFACLSNEAPEAKVQLAFQFFPLAVALKTIRLEDRPDVAFKHEAAVCRESFGGWDRGNQHDNNGQRHPRGCRHGGFVHGGIANLTAAGTLGREGDCLIMAKAPGPDKSKPSLVSRRGQRRKCVARIRASAD